VTFFGRTVMRLASGIQSGWRWLRQGPSRPAPGPSTLDDPFPFSLVLNDEIRLIRDRRSVYREGTEVPRPDLSLSIEPREPARNRGLIESVRIWYSKLSMALNELSDRENVSRRAASARPDSDAAESAKKEARERALENAEKETRECALDENLVGLAFSGGGIRSATFNLGVLQGLADFGLLKNFDYLSTVSGGGYIGSWFVAWVKRERSLQNVEKQLRPSRVEQSESFRTWEGQEPPEPLTRRVVKEEEPEPIYHLRSYSNYLAPRTGLLSVDTWVLIAIYLRNLLLNQLIIVPATVVLILLTRYMIILYKPSSWRILFPADASRLGWYNFLAGAMVGLSFRALISTSYLVRKLRRGRSSGGMKPFAVLPLLRTPFSLLGVVALAVLPPGRGILSSYLTSWSRSFDWIGPRSSFFDGVVFSGLILGLFFPEYLVGVVYGVRRLFFRIVDVIRQAVGLGPLPRYEDSDDDAEAPRRTQLCELQLGILLPVLVSALLFCQQFEAGGQGGSVGSPWLNGTILGGPEDKASLISSLIPRGGLDYLRRWWPEPGRGGKALALGVFIGLQYALAQSLVVLFGAANAVKSFWKKAGRRDAVEALSASVWSAMTALPIGLLGGAILFFVVESLARFTSQNQHLGGVAALLLLGPPLALLVFVVGVLLEVGLLGDALGEDTREWWASLSAWVLLCAIGWVAVIGITLFGRFAVDWFGYQVKYAVVAQSALIGSWLATSITGVLAARDARSRSARQGGPREWVAAAAPPVFVVGLLVLTSVLVGRIMQDPLPQPEAPEAYWSGLLDVTRCATLRYWIVIFGLIFLVMWWRVNVNQFSLHDLYANRLIRCYLGASRPRELRGRWSPKYSPSNCEGPVRQPNPITQFDPDDDLPLGDLTIRRHDQHHPEKDCYVGPLCLINTAMNLVQGDELAWQERMAESFVLTPVFCGSKSTGYRRLPDYGGNLGLGRATSISGAAASPNMGYHSSPAVTALMTIFNVRLGWWLGNPRYSKWRQPGPGMGSYLVDELFGRTNARQDYVYLSDGGHFENLGVYELVRRRCRFILVCDAGADPKFEFFDLGSLVRKCRTDFGVRIEIDTTPLVRQGERSLSRWHCAIGKIHYEDVDPQAIPGILVYVKPTLTGDEPSDILNYASQNAQFPHQSTLNQFYGESQFESYRALGHHSIREVFREAVRDIGHDLDQTDQLFAELQRHWFPPPPDLEKNFRQTSRAITGLQRDLRMDDDLRRLSEDLYPELADDRPPPPPLKRDAEFHTVNQMLHLMEEAWIGDQLESYHQHPMNRGWMNAFRRWTRADAFQRHWVTLRGMFTADFVRFCERELYLRTAPARPQRVSITVPPPPPVVAGGEDTVVILESPSPAEASPLMPPYERDCDRSRLHATTPPSSFVVESSVEPPRPPLVFSTDDPDWPEAYRAINHEFQLEWPGLRWKKLGSDGVGLDPLVAAASRSIEGEAINMTGSRVWLVTIPRAGNLLKQHDQDNPSKSRTCGLILIWNRPADPNGTDKGVPYELFIWLQGPYRTLSVGREALALVLDEFWEERSNQTFTIKTRYPVAGAAGSADRWQAGIWLNFFHVFAFRSVRHLTAQEIGTPGPEEPSDLVVQRTFYPSFWPTYKQDRERAWQAGRSIAGVIASTRHAPAKWVDQ
jgi:Patatin-like phospholipase